MILLISGRQGCGKTTLANSLCKEFGPVGAIKMRFAQPLYEMHDACRSVLDKFGVKNYDYNKKDGYLLQLLGTDWARHHIDKNVWVQCLLNQIRTIPKNVVILVEDMRFKNEFDAFNNTHDVLRIRLHCEREIRKQRASMWRETDTHPSEIDLDEYAEQGLFDMYFNTGIMGVDEITQSVIFKIKQMQCALENEVI